MLDSLEPRRLLSVTASFNSGTLTVTSDAAADHVLIGTNAHGQIFVHTNHHVILAVSAHHVARINVDLGGGNDALDTAATVRAPMTIRGGAGNDTLVAGSGHDMVFGDDGDDFINSADGTVDVVDGGAGHDSALVDHVDHVSGVEHVHHPHHHHYHHHDYALAFGDKMDEIRVPVG